MNTLENSTKKILLICNYFAPDNAIAAVRTTKLAKYLTEYGYKVDVLTEYKNNPVEDKILADDAQNIRVFYAYHDSFREKLNGVYSSLIKPVREPLFNNVDGRTFYDPKTGIKKMNTFQESYPLLASFDYIGFLSKQKGIFHSAKNFLRNAGFYDYCYASYGDYLGLFAGLYYKKLHPGTKLIFDFRDSVYNPKFNPEYLAFYAKHIERLSYLKSDAIITVTEQMKKNIPNPFRKKTAVITNGYDKADRRFLTDKFKSNDKLTLCYTGTMYGGLRDLSPVFKAVSELINDEIISQDCIEIRYAGRAFEVFLRQVSQYGIEKLCVNYGLIPREEAMSLQSSSDLLLLSTWEYQENNNGTITGKALEYMSADKPVISVINGDVGKGEQELGRIAEMANLGCVYYETAKNEDYITLKEYIFYQYNSFKLNGKTVHNPDYNFISRFSYDNIVKKLVKVLEGLE